MRIGKKTVTITLSGLFLLIASAFLFFIALLVSNTAIYILFFSIISMFISSFIIASWTLSSLHPIRKMPKTVLCFRSYLFSIGLENRNPFFSAYSLKIKDVIKGKAIDKPCYFFKVPKKAKQTTFYQQAFVERGDIEFNGLKVSTTFPFSIFKISVFLPLNEKKTIFPDVVYPPKKINIHLISSSMDIDYSIRPFLLGDHPKLINWQESLRRGQIMTRNDRSSGVQPVWIKLENRLIPHIEGGYIRASDQFEFSISLSAGMAKRFLSEGFEVGIIVRGGYLSPVAGLKNISEIMDFLANLKFNEGAYPQIPPRSIIVDISKFSISESATNVF